MRLKQFTFWVWELQAGCRPDKFRQESDSAHLTMNAIPISVLAICSAVWFLVGVVSAEQTDFSAASASNEKPEPVSPGEAEIVALLEQLGPRSKGMGVGINDDGAATLSISADEENDLSALSGLRVRHVQIMGSMSELAAGRIMDLGPLAGMPLETLWVWKVPLKDLSPLKTTRLKKLLIMGAKITDISPLKDLPLTDLAPLQETKLQTLSIKSPKLTDFSAVRNLPLKYLNIRGCGASDLGFLEGMSLEDIHFDLERITEGLEVLRGMKALKQINFCKTVDFWKERDRKMTDEGDSSAADPFSK